MTPKEGEIIAKADMTNVTLLNFLLLFMEEQGILKQNDFIAFLDRTMSTLEPDHDPAALQMLQMKIEALRLQPSGRTTN